MPYTSHNWMAGDSADATKLNNLETQYTEATNSFEQDLFTGFVKSGLVATKDGTTANQLDVTAGVAFLLQTDSTLRRRAPASSTQTTSAFTATYHLYLQPDGSWYWSTSNSPATHSLFVAQVTTDGSGNISTVTDERTINTTLLSGMLGVVKLGAIYSDTGDITSDGSGNITMTGLLTANATAAPTYYFGPSNNAHITWGNSNHETEIQTPLTGSANGHLFITWNGSATTYPFGIGSTGVAALSWVDNSGNYNGPAGGGLPTTRNGTATSVPVFTGTSSPSSPPTGSIWVKA